MNTPSAGSPGLAWPVLSSRLKGWTEGLPLLVMEASPLARKSIVPLFIHHGADGSYPLGCGIVPEADSLLDPQIPRVQPLIWGTHSFLVLSEKMVQNRTAVVVCSFVVLFQGYLNSPILCHKIVRVDLDCFHIIQKIPLGQCIIRDHHISDFVLIWTDKTNVARLLQVLERHVLTGGGACMYLQFM